MIKVVIADDHKLVREAWTLLLSRDERLSIIAICENGEQVIEACRRTSPDVVLMDINMEPVNGIEATRAIRQLSQDIRVIGISVHTDLPYIHALMQAGANGYVTKSSSGTEMVRAIVKVAEGERYFCKEIEDLIKTAY
jgi:Response regulator containing a CheY-like receiver domain and an HTH DNA-binding domain